MHVDYKDLRVKDRFGGGGKLTVTAGPTLHMMPSMKSSYRKLGDSILVVRPSLRYP